MKHALLGLLIMASCGDPNFSPNAELAKEVSDNNQESECIYGPEEQVQLVYSDETDLLVGFWVLTKERKFKAVGTMSKECGEDFKTKGQVSARYKKIISGGCSRIVIFPDDYYNRPGCFSL